MDIRFCDLCDSSIPEADVERGAARRRRGRWFCAPCGKAMARRRVVTAFLFPLAFLAAAGLGAGVAVKLVEPRIATAAAEVAALRTRLVDAAREDPQLPALLSSLVRTDAELQRALGSLRTAQEDRGRGVDDALAALADRLTTLEDSMTEVREYIAERDSRPSAPEPVEEGASDAAAVSPPPKAPGVDDWLPLLEDDDPGARMSALVALEKFEDPRVTAGARAALKDSDPSVKAQAARILGDRSDPGAVDGLIELLMDKDALVRSRAHAALEQIAGVALPYDPLDPEEEREEAVAEIRAALTH